MKHRNRLKERLKAKHLPLLPVGFHHDGGGLLLKVEETGARRWYQRLTVKGRRVNRGLGPYPLVSLVHARELSQQARMAARNGKDIAIERRLATAKATTVEEAFDAYFAVKAKQLSNARHREQWPSTLETYAFPVIGTMAVGDVTPSDIIEILKPIWVEKAETAKRVLQRLKSIFDYAITNGWRESDPCRGVVQALGGTKHRDVKHHRALPYGEVPAFIRTLRTCNSNPITRLAFEFLILTATRSGEMRKAAWPEIDFENAVWVIPKERMKAKVAHRVPLSHRALEILRMARGPGTWKDGARPLLSTTGALEGRGLIFPSWPEPKPLSDMTLTKVLRDLGFADRVVPHGFRTSFRTWAAETDQCRWEVGEAALAHRIKDKTEAAYLRATYFDERVGLMQRWATHCSCDSATLPVAGK
jgi:integrase